MINKCTILLENIKRNSYSSEFLPTIHYNDTNDDHKTQHRTQHLRSPVNRSQFQQQRSLISFESQLEQEETTTTTLKHHYHRYFIPKLFTENQKLQDNTTLSSSLTSDDTTITIEIPIVIQLSGELGNHLSKLAAGIGVAAMIHQYNINKSLLQQQQQKKKNFYFTTNVHVRHQDHTTKGDIALQILHNCFPNLLYIDEDTRMDGAAIVSTTTSSKGSNNHPNYSNINSNYAIDVDGAVQKIIQDAIRAYETSILSSSLIATTSLERDIPSVHLKRTTDEYNSSNTMNYYRSPTIVYSNHLVGYFDIYMDRYYHLYQQYFVMNETNPACNCMSTSSTGSSTSNIIPSVSNNYKSINTSHLLFDKDPSFIEIIFYYRGYQIELPKKGIRLGYEEIHPDSLVEYIRLHYDQSSTINTTNGIQITILSRFPNHTQTYVSALQNAGYNKVHVMQHIPITSPVGSSNTDNGMASILHDFCYLRGIGSRLVQHRELIGPIRSTFFMWASILSSTSSAMTTTNGSTTTTAYTTSSQMQWAILLQQQQQEQSSSTSILDSITPIYYYNNSKMHNPWTERDFHFPIFTYE